MMKHLAVALVTLALAASAVARPEIALGPWRAWLESPGGELPFGLEIVAPATDDKPGGLTAFLVNGEERLEVPVVKWEGDELVLSMDYYDAHLRAKVSEGGKRLDGEFTKQRANEVARMPFHATAGASSRFQEYAPLNYPANPPIPPRLSGRWEAKFASDADASVVVLDQAAEPKYATREAPANMLATVLTTTGDYRFIAGDFNGKHLRLSCFDGAHAFLLTAYLQPDGSLKGDFWSGNWSHTTWTAVRDDNAALPDAFTQVKPVAGATMNALSFPDLEGKPRSLSEATLGAEARCRIYYVFGSWCPNCKDCTAYLNELLDKHGKRGLSVTGLAFEVTGDRERDAKQAKTYSQRAHVQFPVLLAGKSDRKATGEALAPVLESFKAWPTVIFADRAGKIRAVYTGFSGPATGADNVAMRAQWEKIIEEMLAE